VAESAASELTAHAAQVSIDRQGLGAEGDGAGECGIAGGFGATGRSQGGTVKVADEGRPHAVDAGKCPGQAGCHGPVHGCGWCRHRLVLHASALVFSGCGPALAQTVDGRAKAGLHAAEGLGELANFAAAFDVDVDIEFAQAHAVGDLSEVLERAGDGGRDEDGERQREDDDQDGSTTVCDEFLLGGIGARGELGVERPGGGNQCWRGRWRSAQEEVPSAPVGDSASVSMMLVRVESAKTEREVSERRTIGRSVVSKSGLAVIAVSSERARASACAEAMLIWAVRNCFCSAVAGRPCREIRAAVP